MSQHNCASVVLLNKMEEISLRDFGAGWLDQLEYHLWQRGVEGDREGAFLIELAREAGCWWTFGQAVSSANNPGWEWPGPERKLVTIREWRRLFASWYATREGAEPLEPRPLRPARFGPSDRLVLHSTSPIDRKHQDSITARLEAGLAAGAHVILPPGIELLAIYSDPMSLVPGDKTPGPREAREDASPEGAKPEARCKLHNYRDCQSPACGSKQ